MEITVKGEPTLVEGVQPRIGEKAPTFSLVNLKKQIIQLSDLISQPLLISVVPDIDTRICSIQTKRFNQEAAEIKAAHFITISNNTREEQAGWCAAEGVDMEILHDTDLNFGRAYGLVMPSKNRLARSIFVVDTNGTIVYEEIVPEMAQEPDYTKALAALKNLL